MIDLITKALLNKIQDADQDSYLTVEKTADADELEAYLKNVLVQKIHTSGIVDFPEQSGCSVRLSAEQSIPDQTVTKVRFNSKIFDYQNEFNTSTYRFTATKAGIYLVIASLEYIIETDVSRYRVYIYKNGANIKANWHGSSGMFYQGVIVAGLIPLSENDYIEVYTFQNTGESRNINEPAARTFLDIVKIT